LANLLFPVLNILSDGKFHSGEAIANHFKVSRVSIWQAMTEAEKLGVEIFSVRGKGYSLSHPVQFIDEDKVRESIGEMASWFNIKVFDVLDSTNNFLMQEAPKGYPHASCVATNIQTSGKGRRGRQWQSSLGENLTFSFLWRFSKGAAALSGLSLAVGTSLIRSLKKINVNQALLKWPNDILVEDDGEYKKLAGILIELQGDMDGQSTAIIGVGINLKLSKKQLAKIDQPAIGINQCVNSRVDSNEFLGTIIKDLTEVLAKFESNHFEYFKDEWQSYDAFQDQSISISLGDGGIISGKEHGVNNMGALEVITEDGIKTFSSGEVSIRKAE
jgi:BirA family biotin operon repressor/biotin-[acetyl-CoA-carboxylase] ligase|tara:strand:- start:1829 stop:2818 length:990 start_codon:yes stop_codon:yes gene_type:complete